MMGGRNWQLYEKISRYKANDIPTAFTTLAEARFYLMYGWHASQSHLHSIPGLDDGKYLPELDSWQRKSFIVYKKWSSALDAYLLSRGGILTIEEEDGLRILQAQSYIALTTLAIAPNRVYDQTRWDEFNPMFENIISLAADVVQRNVQSETSNSFFSLYPGVIAPVFAAISRCRDPVVRRKGIAILKSSSRQEGILNSFLVAKVAERVVELEESGLGDVRCCEDVPNWARISEVRPSFDLVERRVTLTYCRWRCENYVARQSVKEVIEW
jgi:hypothetical protein